MTQKIKKRKETAMEKLLAVIFFFDSSTENCTVHLSKEENSYVYSTRIMVEEPQSVINRDSKIVKHILDFFISKFLGF